MFEQYSEYSAPRRGKIPKVHDRVGYSKAFLQSTGQITGDVPFMRGTIIAIKELAPGFALATVRWEGDYGPRRVQQVNLANLWVVGDNSDA